MKKKNSLKRNEEIAKIVHSRNGFRNECFALYYSINSQSDCSRICISVGKKIGIAVLRNKTKRQIREMVTDIFDLKLNYDFVVVVRNDYMSNDFATNKEKLEKLYNKFIFAIKE